MDSKAKLNSCYLKFTLIFGAIFVILLILAPISLNNAIQKNARLQSVGIKTTAEVIGFDGPTTADYEITIISFNDEAGNVHTMPLGYYSTNMYIGMKIAIIYDPNNVNTIVYADNNSFFANYGGGILLAAGALLSGSAALVTLIRFKHKFENQIKNKI